jgi:hypothetical protein
LEDSEPNDISSIYSASISLESNVSSDNSSICSADISLTSSQESNVDFHSDLEQSPCDMSDVIGDSSKSGKIS